MINLQTFKIAQSMGFDQKNIFHRLTKAMEEQGELVEAFELNDFDETIEEAVDNLLVNTSIAYVIKPSSMADAQGIVNDAFNSATFDSSLSQGLLMKFIIKNGRMSDAIQKNQKIAASHYKGAVTDEEALQAVYTTLKVLCSFLRSVTEDVDKINALILKKNKKWLEKSKEGIKHANTQAALIVA
jgi:hypothetical protein